MDHAVAELHVFRGEGSQLTRPQAERDRQYEQDFKPDVGVSRVVQPELGAAGGQVAAAMSEPVRVTVAPLRGLVPQASSISPSPLSRRAA